MRNQLCDRSGEISLAIKQMAAGEGLNALESEARCSYAEANKARIRRVHTVILMLDACVMKHNELVRGVRTRK